MKKILFFIFALAIVIRSQIIYDPDAVPKHEDQLKFLSYVGKYGKTYENTQEFNKRLINFIAVDNFINSYDEIDIELGHNQFSDWSPEEKDKILGKISNVTKENEKD